MITGAKEKGLHSLSLDLNGPRVLPSLHLHRKICIGDVYASVPVSVSLSLGRKRGRDTERQRKVGAEETDYWMGILWKAQFSIKKEILQITIFEEEKLKVLHM